MTPALARKLPEPATLADVDAIEAASGVRHEFHQGQLVAMSGGTVRHATIALNTATALRLALKGQPCRPLLNDLRVHVKKANAQFYPDVVVLCGEANIAGDGRTVVEDATVIIEVLSPSTESTDRSSKMRAYRQLASLAAYVLVAQNSQHVEVYAPGGDIGWTLLEYGPGEQAQIPGLNIALAVDDVYLDTDTSGESTAVVQL